MTEEIRQALRALELDEGASLDEITAAYRDLVQVWHPDRHQQAPERLQKRAEQKMVQLNEAYAVLRAYAGALSPEQEPPSPEEAFPRPIKIGNRWGYVTRTGRYLVGPVFDEAEPFFKGWARAVRDGRRYRINTRGAIYSDQF